MTTDDIKNGETLWVGENRNGCVVWNKKYEKFSYHDDRNCVLISEDKVEEIIESGQF